MLSRAIFIILVGLGSSTSAAVAANNASTEADPGLKVGRAINIFSRYGYLSLSMKVVPRNDSNPNWIFREPTVDIFKSIDGFIIDRKKVSSAAASNQRNTIKKSVLFDGDFHLEFCDNLRQLLQAYFRDFTIERLQKPWRAFSGSWTPEFIAKNLGINSSFVQSTTSSTGGVNGVSNDGEHCFVLVRVSRFRNSYKLNPLPANIEIAEKVQEEMDSVRVGDSSTVEDFIRKFGSHYITSYVTGNSLYQVFVYSKKVYSRIKERLKSQGIGQLSNNELSNYFSPWYAEHMGQIKVASGNQTMEAWASQNLKLNYYIFTYASLLKLHGDTNLLRNLNNLLENEALLQLDLKALTPAFKNPTTRNYFQEVLDNYLKLWEVNM